MGKSFSSIWRFAIAVPAWALIASSANAANLVVNGSFENGISPFYLNINNSAGGALVTRATAAPGGGTVSAKLTVSKSFGNIYDLAVIQPNLQLTANQQYTVSFFAKASASGRQVLASIAQGYSPWSSYAKQTFTLTTGWKQYSFTYTQNVADTNVQVALFAGAQTGYVLFDLVSVTPVAPAPVPTPASKFKVGDRVQALNQVNVRASGSITATLLGTQPMGATGTLISGPAGTADGILWWKIDYDTGIDGFSGDDNFDFATTSSPAPAPAPSPTPSTVPGVTSFSGVNGAIISVGAELYSVENSNKSYSLTNPDSQTLRFELHSYEYWCTVSGSYCDSYGGWERSEIQGKDIPNDQTIHISYQFMLEPGQATQAWGSVFGQLWSLGASPPFNVGMEGENMSVRIGWLTWKGSALPVVYTTSVNGNSVSYGYAYQDPTPIQRGHYYNFDITINFARGTLSVIRDGVQIVNYNGPLGFDGPAHWEYGIYRAPTTSDIQAVNYRNMLLTTSP